MECINKANGECFTEIDVSLLEQMAEETAPSLQNSFMQSALRIITQGLQDSSSKDYLSQFIHKDISYIASPNTSPIKKKTNREINDTPKIYLMDFFQFLLYFAILFIWTA